MLVQMAKATYEKWIEDVRDLEPRWDDLPESHRDRLVQATRAGLMAARSLDLLAWASFEAEAWRDGVDYIYWGGR